MNVLIEFYFDNLKFLNIIIELNKAEIKLIFRKISQIKLHISFLVFKCLNK